MKTAISYIIILLMTTGVFAQPKNKVFLFSYFNGNGEDGLHLAYSEDGYAWQTLNNGKSFLKPSAGKDKLMRDPCIIQGDDGEFHMVWTVSWFERGIGYAHSKDLINWSEQQYLPVMEHEPGARNCWAPELFYDKELKTYMIFWATTIPGRFKEGENQGDNKLNHRIYYVTTQDFKTFSETKLLYDQGFNVIDATLVKTDGVYTLFLKDETKTPPQKNIRIATSRSLTGGYSKPGEKITGDWVEGPTVAKIGNDWVIYFDQYTKGKMGAVRTDDLLHWSDISDQVSFPEGTRHGTVFKANRKVLKKLQEL